MCQILDNRLMSFFQFLPLLLYPRPLVFIALTHHSELLLDVLDGLPDLRLLGKQVLLCVAVSDDVWALFFNLRQQRSQILQRLAVLFKQFYIHTLSCQFCLLLFVKLGFLGYKLLIPDSCF